MNHSSGQLAWFCRTAWIVFVVSLCLTYLSWQAVKQQHDHNMSLQFKSRIEVISGAIQMRIQRHEQILQGAAGLFEASNFVDSQEWHAYVNRLELANKFPAFQGLGYSQWLTNNSNNQSSQITYDQISPPGTRPSYSPIIYLEPQHQLNFLNFGQDLFADPRQQAALQRAAISGKSSLSLQLKLQTPANKLSNGFMIYVPIYQSKTALNTEEQRLSALRGFIFAPIYINHFMNRILGNDADPIFFEIYDGKKAEAQQLNYQFMPGDELKQPILMEQRTLLLLGQEWTLRFYSSPKFEQRFDTKLDEIVLITGLGISLLLFFLIASLSSGRHQAEKIALKMTRDAHQRESKLRQQQIQLQAVLDGAEHLIIATDTQGIIQVFNHAAEQHLGYQAEELIGKQTPGIFHDITEVSARAEEISQSGFPIKPGFEVFVHQARQQSGGDTREWTYIHKNGHRFPVSLTITAIHDQHNQLCGFLGVATDITERRRYENELQKLSRALEYSPVAVMITNVHGVIEYVNSKFANMSGYFPLEIIGQDPSIMKSGLTPETVYQDLWSTILGGREWHGRLQNRHKNGGLFWEEIHISPVSDKQGKISHFVAIKEDISQRVMVENMQSEFVSTVSHELRTPITSIQGSLALLVGQVKGELPSHIKPLIEIALRNSERLSLLINDILDFEKIDAGKMEIKLAYQDVRPLIEQVLEQNQAYATQHQVEFQLQPPPAEAFAYVDSHRLQQVLSNLLSNAAKFSPAHEIVKIELINAPNHIQIAIHNHGEGIPAEFRDRIFEKFVRVDSSDTRQKGGTGLGLAISKALIEKMGGTIRFESEPQQLTSFYIELPTSPKQND